MNLDVTVIGCYLGEKGLIEKEKDFCRMGSADSSEAIAGRIAHSIIGVKGAESVKVRLRTKNCKLVSTFTAAILEGGSKEYIENDILRQLNDIQEKEASATSPVTGGLDAKKEQ